MFPPTLYDLTLLVIQSFAELTLHGQTKSSRAPVCSVSGIKYCCLTVYSACCWSVCTKGCSLCIVLNTMCQRENRPTSCFPQVHKAQTCKTWNTHTHTLTAKLLIPCLDFYLFSIKRLWKQHLDVLNHCCCNKKKIWGQQNILFFLFFLAPFKWFIIQSAQRFNSGLALLAHTVVNKGIG